MTRGEQKNSEQFTFVVSCSFCVLYIENLCEFVRLMIANEEKGLFWPQNEEYSNTSELVRLIAGAHEKKMWLVRGGTWTLKLLSCFTCLVNKAFGSLSYERSMSEYRSRYCMYTLAQSFYKTELK